MKVLLDSNIIISALLYRGKSIIHFLDVASLEHELVISSTIIDEVKDVLGRKDKHVLAILDKFFNLYRFIKVDVSIDNTLEIDIRDPQDRHVVISALASGADVLVTGDKDFFDKKYAIEILTPSEFLSKYTTRR